MDQADIPTILSHISGDDDAPRKMAVFKLQSAINDPAFADVFISSGGLVVLRRLIMTAMGNTLAYSLQSLSRLLEVDMGWEIFEGPSSTELIERIVTLIATNPVVNILRGALSVLVAVVSRSQSPGVFSSPALQSRDSQVFTNNLSHAEQEQLARRSTSSELSSRPPPARPATAIATTPYGFRALRPAIAVNPAFFELVIAQLQSADHSLCANALSLINALVRDVLMSDPEFAPLPSSGNTTAKSSHDLPTEDWAKFINRLQDLGLIKSVYNLMQSSSPQDMAHPLIEFQGLTKALLRRWREVPVDIERQDHRRALKGLHIASLPEQQRHHLSHNHHHHRRHISDQSNDDRDDTMGHRQGSLGAGTGTSASRKSSSKHHHSEKWRRLGFETESPAQEFAHLGFLGLMDLTDFVRKNEDGYQKLLLEQSTQPRSKRCPIAKASMAVTMILYEHFEVDRPEEEAKAYRMLEVSKNNDRIFRPLILQWSRLHTAGLQAFFRLWKSTGAEVEDFDKVGELVRILVDHVVGQAVRTRDVSEIEDEMHDMDCARLRELQTELLELAFEEQWGNHLVNVREALRREALQFVKEQRIRCLLQGAWFSKPAPKPAPVPEGADPGPERVHHPWRFAKLSYNRRFLHFADFSAQTLHEPSLEVLMYKVDLSNISSVVSNVSAADRRPRTSANGNGHNNSNDPSSRNGNSKINSNNIGDADHDNQDDERQDMSDKDNEFNNADDSNLGDGHNRNGRDGDAQSVGSDRSRLRVSRHQSHHQYRRQRRHHAPKTVTKITIYSYSTAEDAARALSGAQDTREEPILTLNPTSHSVASEWLDGLLMLLNQAPITAETTKLVSQVADFGLKIRLLNVRLESLYTGTPSNAGVVPSRDGLDEDYYYQV